MIIFFVALVACDYHGIRDLRQNSNVKDYPSDERSLSVMDYDSYVLNYVAALLNSSHLLNRGLDSSRLEILMQHLSMVGDIRSVNILSEKWMPAFPQLKDSAYVNKFKRKKLKPLQAKDHVLASCKNQQVVMFNEAHDRPQTRAFLLSLLPELKKMGFTCLAMETFSEKGNFEELRSSTGYYTNEPVSGDIVREGLRLGFKMIPYEDYDRDTSYLLNPRNLNRRERVQATNLYNRIKYPDGVERTIVLAGYGHIKENSGEDFISMAMNFKMLSGINPFTIDQTLFIENNYNYGYGHPLLEKVFSGNEILAFKPNDLKGFGLDSSMYDLHLFHPRTRYEHQRPTWLLTGPDRKFVKIKIPFLEKVVMIQAYEAQEIKNEEDYKSRVPVDQTFYAEGNCAWLVLKNKSNYRIVFRNDKNKILEVRELSTD